jgi:hypothetical protein
MYYIEVDDRSLRFGLFRAVRVLCGELFFGTHSILFSFLSNTDSKPLMD